MFATLFGSSVIYDIARSPEIFSFDNSLESRAAPSVGMLVSMVVLGARYRYRRRAHVLAWLTSATICGELTIAYA